MLRSYQACGKAKSEKYSCKFEKWRLQDMLLHFLSLLFLVLWSHWVDWQSFKLEVSSPTATQTYLKSQSAC